MKVKISIITSITIATLLLSVYQPSAAAPYYNHDGSVDDSLEKIMVKEFHKGENNWVYRVQVCADENPIRVTQMILKSDIDQKKLGVNKIIPKGECKSYGAIMKAKDPNTLGAEMVETHEAVEKMKQLLEDMPSMSKKDRKVAHKQLIELFVVTGFMPR